MRHMICLLATLYVGMLFLSSPIMAQNPSMKEINDFQQAYQQQDINAKKEGLEKFIETYPQSPIKNDAKLVLSDVYKDMKDTAKQIELLQQIITDDPEHMDAHNNLSLAYLADKKLDQAEQIARKALELAQKMTIQTLRSSRITDEQFKSIKHNIIVSYSAALATILVEAGKKDQVSALIDPFLTDPPSMEQAALELAKAFKAAGATDKALKILDPLVTSAGEQQEEIKTLHKSYYVELNGSEKDYDKRLEQALKDGQELKRKELIGSFIKKDAPVFSFDKLDGTKVTGEQLKGKIVILTFWATWCRPCHMELPHIQKTYEKFKDDASVTILGVSTDEPQTKTQVPSFVTSKNLTFPIAYGGADAKKFGFTGIPTLMVLDTKGRIRFQRSGFDPQGNLVDELSIIIDTLKQEKE